MLRWLSSILFPPKCIFCRKLLQQQETDLCRKCRTETHGYPKQRRNIRFIENWSALWYYNGNVRKSLLRYKFHNARSYASVYGRFLAMHLQQTYPDGFDVLTWVPISAKRKRKRGYDQVELIANSVGTELQLIPAATLRKIKDVKPQSSIKDAVQRRANILGAFQCISPESVAGKRILLLDDIITTGATASECARILLTAGAKEIYCAAVAAAPQDTKK